MKKAMNDAWNVLKQEGQVCPIHGESLIPSSVGPVCRECLRAANPTDGSPRIPYPNQ